MSQQLVNSQIILSKLLYFLHSEKKIEFFYTTEARSIYICVCAYIYIYIYIYINIVNIVINIVSGTLDVREKMSLYVGWIFTTSSKLSE